MKHLQAIKAKLKEQHPGLPDAILDRVANTLAKTAKDEATDEELTQAVANQKEMVTDLADYAQKEGDRRATEAQKKAENKNPATPATPANPAKAATEPAKQEDEVVTLLKGLSARLESFEKKEAAKTHTETLQGLLKDKVPASFYTHAVQGREFKDADEVNTFAEQISQNYTAFQQELANSKLGQQTPPAQGAAASGDEKEDLTESEKAYVDSLKPKTA